jgi:DNA polymerase-3 subunit epsilon
LLQRTARFIALDVETANSDASSICQIGLAVVDDDGAIDTFSFMVDPEAPFTAFNTNLHGISAQTVDGCPSFREVFETLSALLARHPIVQHSNFDKRAIEGACRLYGLPKPDLVWHDSVRIARRAWPELSGNGGHGLASLKSHLGLEFNHHDAAEDAKAAAQVVLLAEKVIGASPFAPQSRAATNNTAARKAKSTPKPTAKNGDLNGHRYGHAVCFSGQLTISRNEAVRLATEAGIEIKGGVSKKVSLLVLGDFDFTRKGDNYRSAKHKRAEELIAQGHEIQILRESEFMEFIRE